MLKPNPEILAKCLCMGTALLIAGTFSVNPVTFIYAVFILLAVRSTVQLWMEWRILIFVFYILAVVAATLMAAFLTFYWIVPEIVNRNWSIGLYAIIGVDIASIVSLWITISTYSLFNQLYVDPHGEPIPSNLAGEHFIAEPSK